MRIIDADAFDKCLEQAEIEAKKNQRYVFASALDMLRGILANVPSEEQFEELQLIRCKDCKHRYEIECPMRHIEWVEYEEDGYFETDDIIYDRTIDDGFCDRGEKEDE